MAKRKEDTPPPGSPAWMNTFSDLMNLLLCFFVMLFSMSSVDEDKYNALVASMQQSFSLFSGGATAIGDGILISNGVSQLNELDQYINSTGKAAESDKSSDQFNQYDPGKESDTEMTVEQMAAALQEQYLKDNEQLAEKVTEAVAESAMSQQIEVSFNGQYVQLSLRGALLFDSGKVEIKDEAKPVLDKVGVILERYAESIIEVEGHTDNVPISNSKYASNDELSSARAISVFHYLVDHTTLDPASIKHSGRGEWDPIDDNSTESGRARNRRVEIRIYHPAQTTAVSAAE